MNTLTTDALRAHGKRLIILDNANQYSSYGDGNSTLVPGPIVAEFERMTAPQAQAHAFTLWQSQATATNIRDVVIQSVLFANTATSCLMATKPICDVGTLPWLQANLPRAAAKGRLNVIMNDFFDGATADVAIAASRKALEG